MGNIKNRVPCRRPAVIVSMIVRMRLAVRMCVIMRIHVSMVHVRARVNGRARDGDDRVNANGLDEGLPSGLHARG